MHSIHLERRPVRRNSDSGEKEEKEQKREKQDSRSEHVRRQNGQQKRNRNRAEPGDKQDDFPEKRRPVCTHFYHTSAAPTPALRKLLHLLAEVDDETAGADLARALFRLTRGFLANDNRSRTGKAERTFQEIRQYMAENFCLPLTREETAAYFQLNPNYLSRLFRQRSGSSFSEILRSMRLEHAAFLLRTTDLLVDEITLQCGYQSTPFFTSAFHRHFGLPPGQYRLKHKKASGDNADS